MMNFSALIKERYSVRKFADKKVEKEVLQKLKEDANRASQLYSKERHFIHEITLLSRSTNDRTI